MAAMSALVQQVNRKLAQLLEGVTALQNQKLDKRMKSLEDEVRALRELIEQREVPPEAAKTKGKSDV